MTKGISGVPYVVMALGLAACSSTSAPAPAAVAPPTPAAATAPPVMAAGAGPYTAEQATRGGEVFQRRCARCHEDLSRPTFIVPWTRMPLSQMYTFISTTMPRGAPGALTRQQYVDIVAHLLAINGIPAGPTELPLETRALAQIRVAAPPPPHSN